MNRALECAGREERIDHRSLEEQGIDREPQIHVGPGNQNAAKKGHDFESRDRELAGRAIPYSLLDSGSRAEHNASIIEANRQPVASREHPGQKKLHEAQSELRRAMYRDQKRDRDALRQAQKAQLAQHKDWAKQLYADARKAAFEQVKEQTAGRWEAVRSIGDKDQREEAVEALKREQQQLYAKASSLHIGQARIEKDMAWQTLRQSQLEERRDLHAEHRGEYTALARQHIAERLGVSETHRAKHLLRQANRIEGRLSRHPGMAAQQQTAHKLVQSHAAGRNGMGLNPEHFALALMKTAHAENEKRNKIRQRLNAMRQTNQLRGAQPDRFRAQAGNAMQALGRVMESDPQNQIRQAAASGRALTGDERAAAPQDLKQKIGWQERRAAQRAALIPGKGDRQERGRDGRGGGGRGR